MINQNNNEYKWLQKIKSILNTVGRSDIWVNQQNITNKNIHRQIKQTLIDQFKQSWHAQLTQSNKGLIYNSFKTTHEFESYFKILPRYQSFLLYKYRSANHRLIVERGCYDGTPFNERICPLCESGEVGTERHYLLKCNRFRKSRNLYLTDFTFLITDSQHCFNRLLTSKSEQVLLNLCKLIKIILRTIG